MSDAPIFKSTDEYRSRLLDVDFWWPNVVKALNHHGLIGSGVQVETGYNPTYPVFLVGDIVVKLFGHIPTWRQTYVSECAAHDNLATDERLFAPRRLATGQLFSDLNAPWPYLITTRLSGVSWLKANPSPQEQMTLATELGEQLRYVHALPAKEALRHDEQWASLNITAAAKHSSLPPHLIPQVDPFLSRLEPFDRVFVHGDLVANHIFIERGHITGLIDWGDATVTDRHYEIGKLYFATFGGNKSLLRVLLEAAHWPVGKQFSRQTLGLTLYRQAVGLTQHHSFDVFHTLPAMLPIEDITSLDELATLLFDV